MKDGETIITMLPKELSLMAHGQTPTLASPQSMFSKLCQLPGREAINTRFDLKIKFQFFDIFSFYRSQKGTVNSIAQNNKSF